MAGNDELVTGATLALILDELRALRQERITIAGMQPQLLLTTEAVNKINDRLVKIESEMPVLLLIKRLLLLGVTGVLGMFGTQVYQIITKAPAAIVDQQLRPAPVPVPVVPAPAK